MLNSDEAWQTFTHNRLRLYEGVENTGNPHVLREVCSGLELEAQKALRFLAAVRSRQNALHPISCLPPEILREIFTLVAMDEDEYLQNRIEDYESDDLPDSDVLESHNLGWVKGMYNVDAWYNHVI